MAADAMTGNPLWSFQQPHVEGSPMTYMFDGKQ